MFLQHWHCRVLDQHVSSFKSSTRTLIVKSLVSRPPVCIVTLCQFKGLRLTLSVIGLTAYSLAAPSVKTDTAAELHERQASAQAVQDTLADLATAMMVGSTGRKTDLHGHNSGSQSHEPQHHHAISSLIHLLLTIGSAFAPLIGAIIGPLLTNIASGITWAVSHTIASGKSGELYGKTYNGLKIKMSIDVINCCFVL